MSPMDDDEPTEEELREAEALARALDRGTGASELPEDALETAALLRYAHGDGELGEARQGAILDEILATAKPRTVDARAPGWRALLKWLVPGGVLAAAAIALVVVLRSAPSPSDAIAAQATRLPLPTAALLRAQARVASSVDAPEAGADAAGVLDSEMRSYRGAVFAALESRYGEAR